MENFCLANCSLTGHGHGMLFFFSKLALYQNPFSGLESRGGACLWSQTCRWLEISQLLCTAGKLVKTSSEWGSDWWVCKYWMHVYYQTGRFCYTSRQMAVHTRTSSMAAIGHSMLYATVSVSYTPVWRWLRTSKSTQLTQLMCISLAVYTIS